MGKKVSYQHHGERPVFVDEDLKGKHRDHCLCYSCDRFQPGTADHCPIAQRVYETCVAFDLVTPVYECPEYVEKGTAGS